MQTPELGKHDRRGNVVQAACPVGQCSTLCLKYLDGSDAIAGVGSVPEPPSQVTVSRVAERRLCNWGRFLLNDDGNRLVNSNVGPQADLCSLINQICLTNTIWPHTIDILPPDLRNTHKHFKDLRLA